MESTIINPTAEPQTTAPDDPDADTKFSGYFAGENSQESLISIKQAFEDYNKKFPDDLVYLFHDHPAKVIYNAENELEIKPQDEWTITHTLTAGGSWASKNKSGNYHYGNPPKDVAKFALSAGKHYLGNALPVLKGLHDGILIDTNNECWRIVTANGYDKESGYYLTKTFNMDAIPAEPTDTDVQKARGILKDLLCDFSYADNDKGEDSINYQNTIAALASAIIRPSWNGALPIWVLCKRTERIGGSFLQETIGRLSTGKSYPKHDFPKAMPEHEKLIKSIISKQEQYSIIDNVTPDHDWVTPMLLTYSSGTGETEFRGLGSYKMGKYQPRTFIAVNGNNLPISADVCGRVIPVFMEINKRWQDMTWKRSKKEMEMLALDMHPAAVWATAVFHQNWIAKGKPEPPACAGNVSEYDDWYYEICGMLNAAGYTHILENLRDVQTTDNDADAQTAGFLNALNKKFQWGTEFTATDLANILIQQGKDLSAGVLSDDSILQYINDDTIIQRARHGSLSPDSTGKYLAKIMGRVVTGSTCILCRPKKSGDKRGYYLQDVTQGTNPAA